MTPEQLESVRADRWRQKSNPVLTLEEAAGWIGSVGLSLFLPRRHQFLTSAPSFVEASLGERSDTPAPVAIANARGLMIRMVESGSALPLNLFGALSEQPDFLASREAFPYLFTLRGGRNWKTPPPRATPLAVRIWKLLEDGASLEATEIQAAVGHEITESAVVRGLMDLWGGLRVMPVYEEDRPTRWELTQTRFEHALNLANQTAQTMGLSALVSLYLESVVAATPAEIGTFLSPLTARSKVREVVNGLAATRQIAIVPVGTQTMFHVAGSLPEFAEEEPVATEVAPVAPVPERARPSFQKPRPERPRPDRPRPERRPAFERDRESFRRERPQRDREGFAASGGEGRQQRKPFGAERGGRPPFRKFAAGKPGGKFPRREERGGERKSLGDRPFGRSFDRQAPSNEGKERRSDSRSGGKFPPKRDGGKFPPKKFGKPKFERDKFGAGKPRPWSGDEPARGQGEGRPFRPRREGSFDRPGKPRPYGTGEKRPFFRSKPKESGRAFPDRKFEDRSGAPERSGPPRREWKSKPAGFSKSGKPSFGKPKFGAGRPGGSPGGSKFGGKKFGGPPTRGKSGGARPGFKSGPKPGGSKPPFRKRKDKGDKGNKSSE